MLKERLQVEEQVQASEVEQHSQGPEVERFQKQADRSSAWAAEQLHLYAKKHPLWATEHYEF